MKPEASALLPWRLRREREIVWSAGLVSLAAAIVVFGFVLPPYPAVRGSQPLDVLTPLHYQVTVFLLFGILLAEIGIELAGGSNRRLIVSYFAQLGVVTGFSLLRLAWFIPVSGHCLLIGYYLLRQGVTWRGRRRLRFAAGLAVLAQVMVYKVFVWQDPVTPVTGFLLGGAAWAIGQRMGSNK